jgi:hypothetical protein
MQVGSALLLWLAALAAALIAQAPSGPAPSGAPTFNRDVAPILFSHCTGCHRPGEMAPMSLLTYEDARPWARAILRQVTSRAMPPWSADRTVGRFSNDPSLTDAQIQTIGRWVEAGAPRGDAPAPPEPKHSDGWQIGTPDLVLTIPKRVSIPAKGPGDYQYFEIPTNLPDDRWIQAVEIRPENRKVVHHALAFVRSPGLDGSAPSPRGDGTSCITDVCGDIEMHDARMGPILAATAVGTQAEQYPPGTAKRLTARSIVTLQIHYTPVGAATTDQTAIGFVFAKTPPATPLKMVPMSKQGFTIPPQAPNHVVETNLEFKTDATIWSIGPHAHLRGKAWRFDIVGPDGKTQPILLVPRFDFNWQLVYRFATPMPVTRGSRLRAIAAFDNSSGNPANPDPNATVQWGTMTNDEMMFASIVYSTASR